MAGRKMLWFDYRVRATHLWATQSLKHIMSPFPNTGTGAEGW